MIIVLAQKQNRVTYAVEVQIRRDVDRAAREISEIKNHGWRGAQASKKRPRGGINVKNIGTHLFLTEEVLETIQKAADATAARKAKMKGKGTAGRKGMAAGLVSEADIPLSNEGNPFLESH